MSLLNALRSMQIRKAAKIGVPSRPTFDRLLCAHSCFYDLILALGYYYLGARTARHPDYLRTTIEAHRND